MGQHFIQKNLEIEAHELEKIWAPKMSPQDDINWRALFRAASMTSIWDTHVYLKFTTFDLDIKPILQAVCSVGRIDFYFRGFYDVHAYYYRFAIDLDYMLRKLKREHSKFYIRDNCNNYLKKWFLERVGLEPDITWEGSLWAC